MTENKTYGYLKKRIFDALDEYSENEGVFVTDTNRELLVSRMPDAVTSALVRMYQSLSVGRESCTLRLLRPTLLFESFCIDNGGAEAYFDTPSIAVSFGFYGNGSLVIEKCNGETVFTIECEGDGIKSFKRELINLPGDGSYILKSSDNLKIIGLAVYKNDGFSNADEVPMRGYMSIQLPSDFDGFISIEGDERHIPSAVLHTSGKYADIYDSLYSGKTEINVEYKKSVPQITKETADDFVFDLSPLAFEALVCLSAAELCREEESATYTRLLYKYSDLSEGLFKSQYAHFFKRNSFFKARRRVR